MNAEQLRAMANFVIQAYGAGAFVTALERAKALAEAGDMEISKEWGLIAEQISEIETATELEKVLDRAAAP